MSLQLLMQIAHMLSFQVMSFDDLRAKLDQTHDARVANSLQEARRLVRADAGWQWLLGYHIDRSGKLIRQSDRDRPSRNLTLRSLMLPIYAEPGQFEHHCAQLMIAAQTWNDGMIHEASDVATVLENGTPSRRQEVLERFMRYDAYYLYGYSCVIAVSF